MTRPEAPAIVFAAADRVGLIAGSGRLPVDVAAGLAKAGKPPFVIPVGGETVERNELARYDHSELAVEQIGDLLPLLKRERITHLVMAGSVGRRPKLSRIKWSLSLLRMLPGLVRALARGDDNLLSSLVAYLERNGIRVVGPHQIVPDLLAREGVMTRSRPTPSDQRDLAVAREAALAIGRLDIGQAAVAIGGRVIALEGIEGTDGLLQRVKGLRGHGRIAGKGRGALVKCAKPGQELRADLPTVGPATVEAAHEAGLAGIGLEAGKAFVLDFGKTIELADALDMFVVGLTEASEP